MRDNKNDSKRPPANEPDPLGHNEDAERRAATKEDETREAAQQGAKQPALKPAPAPEPHMQQTRLPGQSVPGQAAPAAAPAAQPEHANPAGPGIAIT